MHTFPQATRMKRTEALYSPLLCVVRNSSASVRLLQGWSYVGVSDGCPNGEGVGGRKWGSAGVGGDLIHYTTASKFILVDVFFFLHVFLT